VARTTPAKPVVAPAAAAAPRPVVASKTKEIAGAADEWESF
jgi:hypothetical protein